ncbi:hypothetical protein B1692_06125, partial [Geobacillus thermoleovorans]
ASLGGPDERREQKFATLVGDHFGMSPTNILLTRCRKGNNTPQRHQMAAVTSNTPLTAASEK